jgi:predicted DNA binding CopG/RHH family protein
MSKPSTKLTKEEKDILDSFELGEWKTARGSKALLKDAKAAACEFLKKDARINIRMSSLDLDLIKQKAVREGLPYQSLITSILHKYAHDYLGMGASLVNKSSGSS